MLCFEIFAVLNMFLNIFNGYIDNQTKDFFHISKL